MSFAAHSDVNSHPVFSKLSLAAFGTWVLAGTWTSANKSYGFVPVRALADLNSAPDSDWVVELVKSGVWTKVDGGYRMEYGPSTDFPLPMWRYDDEGLRNGLFERVPDPDQLAP